MAVLKRSKPLVIDYKPCVIDYILSKAFKTFKSFFSEGTLATDNRLHLLVIDYQREIFKIKGFERKSSWPNLCAFKSNL